MTSEEMLKFIYQVGAEQAMAFLAQVVHDLESKLTGTTTTPEIVHVHERKE